MLRVLRAVSILIALATSVGFQDRANEHSDAVRQLHEQFDLAQPLQWLFQTYIPTFANFSASRRRCNRAVAVDVLANPVESQRAGGPPSRHWARQRHG